MKAISRITPFLFLLISCQSPAPKVAPTPIKNITPIKAGALNQKEILDYLGRDDQEKYHTFIDFEHPYFHTASTRLTLFADKTRWAIVFEKSGYANRGYRGEIELEYFGNCLKNLTDIDDADNNTSNMKTVALISNAEIERIENDQDELIRKEIRQVKVRNVMLNIEQDKRKYLAKNIHDTVYDNKNNLIDVPSMIRYLSEEHPALFRATDQELRQCLPNDLPMLMHIDRWHHEPYYLMAAEIAAVNKSSRISGTIPANNEAYKLMADILVTRDTTRWKPILKPNNDWRNWPMAGYM